MFWGLFGCWMGGSLGRYQQQFPVTKFRDPLCHSCTGRGCSCWEVWLVATGAKGDVGLCQLWVE